ncbi:hypothetical protein EV356DRAFT_213820 [Viridothelium virens]|uniref:Uncharacterized protein n=1 Tax=Viridothelium virens TaxID=1048519 RepID=A0A6A6H629_VIRVR|nr:hypothetical protein EV356DRAFT_213820 [Viridothelium virens]
MADVMMQDPSAATETAVAVTPETFTHFMDLPLEVRRQIYACASERDYGSEYVLKAWLDKVGGYVADAQRIDSHHAIEEISEDGSVEDGEENQHDDDEEQDSDDENETAVVHAGDGQGQQAEDEFSDDDEQESDEDQDSVDEEMADNEQSDDESEDDLDSAVGASESDESDLPAPAPQHPVIVRHTPNRHTVGMFGLSAYPPPTALLQAVKNEVKEGYFSTAFFFINVTGGIRHITFFEEILQIFCDAPFSPLEQIRKMQIRVHWSSKWLKDHERTVDDQGAPVSAVNVEICESMLLKRIEIVADLIAKTMPELRQIKIYWYDVKMPKNYSMNLQSGALAKFWDTVGLNRMNDLDLTVKTTFYEPDEEKDPEVMAIEAEFDQMLSASNGGWL